MKRFAFVLLLVFVTAAAPAFAQTGSQVSPPTVVQQATTATVPTGARIGFVNLEVVFSQSALGKQGQERWRVLNDRLFSGLAARDKEIQGLTAKIQAQQAVIDESVLKQWNRDLAKLQREAQFAQQEAQVQRDQMQEEVLADFQKQIVPVITTLRAELKLDAVLGVQGEAGGLTLLSVDPRLDLSAEVVRRLNALMHD